ncbi:MAG: histidine phosphatase family protein [Bacteroidia bacterium]|nr:histidine phosphatase family protein [Bacteroidia bacterium]MCF8426283.1 histidine phosphatase family protein [Bacteroidia bacterium]MCF8445488.1 histidine phosphatase family protein [Bacteroidia bacterium]
MSKSKLLYIIRHGETDFNRLGIVQGSGIDMPLNDLGILQAKRFYDYYKDIQFSKIYTSSLIRTQQSILPFIEAGKPYKAIPALNEISWGIFEGKPQNPEEREVYWKVVNSWKNGQYNAKILEGESALELHTRQKTFVDYLKQEEGDDCILISMHGRALKAFLCALLDLPLLEMERFEHTNLCLYILEFDGKAFRILKHCDTTHLAT